MSFQPAAATVSSLDFNIARAAGFFEAAGISPSYRPYNVDGAQNLNSVAHGQTDVTFPAYPSAIAALSKNLPVKGVAGGGPVLYDLVISSSLTKELGAKGITSSSPIKDRLEALKGQTFTVTQLGGGAEGWIRAMLAHHGLDSKSFVKFNVIGDVAAHAGALKVGQIDISVNPPPTSIVSADEADGSILISGYRDLDAIGLTNYGVLFVMSDDYLAKYPEAPKRLTEALDSARKLIVSDPAKACDLFGTLETKLDPKLRCDSVSAVAQAFSGTSALDEQRFKTTVDAYNVTASSDAPASLQFSAVTAS